jgi:hypothetical protein
MTSKLTASLLTTGSLLLATVVQAQTSFSIGPKVGLNAATTYYTPAVKGLSLRYRLGIEAGVAGSLSFGHFALQPALLYSQKGYKQHARVDYTTGPGRPYGTADFDGVERLNYVTLPISLAYCQRQNGQGFQVFVGPYLALLLGGNFTNTIQYPLGPDTFSGNIMPDGEDARGAVARRYDAGLQAGLGYRYQALLFQVDYSMGLHTRTVEADMGGRASNYAYNRAFQASLSYLFGPKC